MPDSTAHPNIIILYADDLGYGDVGCYGAADIPTPNVDRLAAEGLRFTEGYATAATCTPSRYSLLTGTYPWRNPAAAILPGDAPMIIQPGTPTLPGMLREDGYRTGVVGKWHLGLGAGDLDWNRDISRTPNHVGFDYAFIMAATNDRVPCVYIENQRVVNLDPADPIEVTYDPAQAFPGVSTGCLNPELLRMQASHGHADTIVNGVGRIGFMRGGKAALWNDETMADAFAEKAVCFITENKDRPFFLYYALHQPHVPRLPGARFKGATPHGARGDVIVEMDWCVGQVLEALDRLGLCENTIVIFSSDNGPVLDDGYMDEARELAGDHRAAGPLRGGKYSLFDGGARVPLIVRWPGEVQPGESAALVSHLDFYASFAGLTGHKLSSEEAPDSFDLHPVFFGKSAQGRRELLAEGMWQKTVLRQGSWAYIPAHAGPAVNATTNTELGNSTDPQLYDLSLDIGQITNVAEKYGSKTRRMASRLIKIRESKRTRPRLS
jgi:arylsulfatase A-like enzyme